MQPFTTLTSVAASLAEPDVDTDIIFPARFLLLLDRKGLGEHLFHERRQGSDNGAAPFVLDTEPWTNAKILVAQSNFGCGSSREQAVWALADFGIVCVIAQSFGEIFFANCFRNGVLPIVLAGEDHAATVAEAEAGRVMTIDLAQQHVALAGGRTIGFDIEPDRKRALLLGLDEIGAVLSDDEPLITRFEQQHWAGRPWLRLTQDQHATLADVVDETF